MYMVLKKIIIWEIYIYIFFLIVDFCVYISGMKKCYFYSKWDSFYPKYDFILSVQKYFIWYVFFRLYLKLSHHIIDKNLSL